MAKGANSKTCQSQNCQSFQIRQSSPRADDREAFAARPETTGKVKVAAPQTGAEYLASLRDGREVCIYGERVKDVTKHRPSATPRGWWRGCTTRCTTPSQGQNPAADRHRQRRHDARVLQGAEDRRGADRRPRRHRRMGEASPMAGWVARPTTRRRSSATLGANADFYAPYQENARRWYKFSQERMPFINHAIIHPPVDRDRPPNEVGDVCCHVEKETDAGIVVSGAKVVATGSVLTNYTFIAHHGLIPVQDKKFAVVFMVPTNTPGVKFICRTSYEMAATAMGSPFDYPLS